MNFRFPRQARDHALVASPTAVAGAHGRHATRRAQRAMPESGEPGLRAPAGRELSRRADALSVACRTLANAPATEMAAISVTADQGCDADSVRSLGALVDGLAEAYGLSAELEVNDGSVNVRFSRD